jgi:small subunit ribosomal protein S6
MAFYECVFVMRQDIPAQDVHGIADGFVSMISSFDSKLLKKEYWGLRNLSHIIKKNKKGHFVMLGLSASTAAINELERNFKINEDILRYITLKVDEIRQAPSHMMSAPAEVDSGSN